MVRGVTVGLVLAETETVFVCSPYLPLLSNEIKISPVAPGAIGSLGHTGTVQPQEPTALEMINGCLPVFVKAKVALAGAPASIFPKSCDKCSNMIEEVGALGGDNSLVWLLNSFPDGS